jgi:hypothetical protein
MGWRVLRSSSTKSMSPKENVYAFRIVPGMENRMLKEKTEIQRLIDDAKGHGKWFIENFEEA